MRKDILYEEIEANKIIYVWGKLGYGKTSLIREICHEKYININWYNASKDTDISLINTLLADAIKSNNVVVIDDFHKLPHKESINLDILSKVHDTSKVIFISRKVAPKEFRLLIMKGKIAIVDLCNLPFTLEDARVYLKNKEQVLEDKELKVIYDKCKKWPIAIEAINCAISMNADSNWSEIEQESIEILYDYLDEKFFIELSEDCKDFLIKISLIDNCTIDICDEMFSDNWKDIYKELTSYGNFIEKTSDDILVIQAFCRRFLRYKSKELKYEELYNFKNKERRYYIKNNMLFEATRVSIDLKEYDIAIQLLEDVLRSQNIISSMHIISEYIDRIPKNEIESSCVLCAFMISYNCFVIFNRDNISYWKSCFDNSCKISSLPSDNKNVLIDKINLMIPYSKRNVIITSIKNIDNWDDRYKTYLNLSCNIPSILRGLRNFDFFIFDRINYKKLKKSIGDDVLSAAIDICYAEVRYQKNDLKGAVALLSNATYVAESRKLASLYFPSYVLMIKIICAEGKMTSVRSMLYKIKDFIVKNNASYLLDNYRIVETKIALLFKDKAVIDNYLDKYDIDDTESVGIIKIYAFTVKARIYIDRMEYVKSLFILEKLYILFTESGRTIDKIENLILQSISYFNMDQKIIARNRIEEAIVLSERYEYIRIFSDEAGKISSILKDYLKTRNLSDRRRKYVKEILMEANKKAKLVLLCDNKQSEEIATDLTYMEEEVFKLLGKGYRYNDIAKELNIKLSTVKTHIYNIYSKLDINTKAQAILIANKMYKKELP